jgi:predicted nucleic-acid-binding Zn-ribbon protein
MRSVMGILSELNTLLEKIPLWSKLQSVPSEVADLRARVEALEAAINTTAGGKCPKCGKMTFRLDHTEADPMFGNMGVQRDVYVCSSCNYSKFEQDA